LYVDLVNKYLPNINTIYDKSITNISYNDAVGVPVVANKLQVPFLFVYDKNNKSTDGSSAPIVSYLEEMKIWADFLTNDVVDPAKIEAYKTHVRPVFDAISTQVDGKKVGSYDTFDAYDYFSKAYNAAAVTTIFNESDKEVVYKTVTYNELTKILESDGNYVILFGGAWCPNTRAVSKLINQYAKKYNIDTIYNFDTKLDGTALHIRDTANPYAKLYVDLVNKYFPQIITQYDKADGKASHKITYIDQNSVEVVASKLQVPYLFTYNKNNKDAQGNSDPILGHIELMYTWANIQPDYVNTAGDIGANFKTYSTALDNLFTPLYSTDLKTLITEVDAKTLSKDTFTTDSYSKVEVALTNAKNVFADTQSTTTAIDEAYAELQLAISGLTLKTATAPVVDNQNPNTGDTNNLVVISLLAVASIGILSLAKLRTKKLEYL